MIIIEWGSASPPATARSPSALPWSSPFASSTTGSASSCPNTSASTNRPPSPRSNRLRAPSANVALPSRRKRYFPLLHAPTHAHHSLPQRVHLPRGLEAPTSSRSGGIPGRSQWRRARPHGFSKTLHIQFYHHFVKRANSQATVSKPPLKIGIPKYTR
jgi:hypothetical protein